MHLYIHYILLSLPSSSSSFYTSFNFLVMVSRNPNPADGCFLDPKAMPVVPAIGPFAAVADAAETVSSGEDLSKKIRKPYTITKSRESWTEPEHDKFLEALQLWVNFPFLSNSPFWDSTGWELAVNLGFLIHLMVLELGFQQLLNVSGEWLCWVSECVSDQICPNASDKHWKSCDLGMICVLVMRAFVEDCLWCFFSLHNYSLGSNWSCTKVGSI